MKYWEIIADKLSAAGWSWGYCSAVTPDGWRWIVDAHRDDSRRYVVHSDELLTAFLHLEATLPCDFPLADVLQQARDIHRYAIIGTLTGLPASVLLVCFAGDV